MNTLTINKNGMPWTGFEDLNGTRIYENDLFFTEDGATNHVIAGSLRDEN